MKIKWVNPSEALRSSWQIDSTKGVLAVISFYFFSFSLSHSHSPFLSHEEMLLNCFMNHSLLYNAYCKLFHPWLTYNHQRDAFDKDGGADKLLNTMLNCLLLLRSGKLLFEKAPKFKANMINMLSRQTGLYRQGHWGQRGWWESMLIPEPVVTHTSTSTKLRHLRLVKKRWVHKVVKIWTLQMSIM